MATMDERMEETAIFVAPGMVIACARCCAPTRVHCDHCAAPSCWDCLVQAYEMSWVRAPGEWLLVANQWWCLTCIDRLHDRVMAHGKERKADVKAEVTAGVDAT